jgi:DNA modification methylase
LADNSTAQIAEWDLSLLKDELMDLDFDMSLFGLEKEIKDIERIFAPEIIEDEVPEVDEKNIITKLGDIWQLGRHRLMCGDSTDALNYKHLLQGVKVDLVFTDPPYGMKKEADGVLNDNLNYDKLLEFNKQWIPLTFDALKDNGSWYCWGIDEPLMDIYAFILKPMMRENKITFRNLITWDKGNGQGQNSKEYMMYAIADEKCLFVVRGITALTLNADQYWEEYEPIRKYLYDSRIAMGWDVPTMKRIVGHSDLSRDHWTSKSQFNMPTREVYEKMQKAAETQRKEKGINNDAFRREYDDLRREYDDLRAYFDNTHDNMNNVWKFDRTNNDERELTGGHATPKPIALCARAIKSSSREGEIVLDVFGGSGSTLIACEQLNRICYMMELDPKYCDVIIKRWEALTGKKAVMEDICK